MIIRSNYIAMWSNAIILRYIFHMKYEKSEKDLLPCCMLRYLVSANTKAFIPSLWFNFLSDNILANVALNATVAVWVPPYVLLNYLTAVGFTVANWSDLLIISSKTSTIVVTLSFLWTCLYSHVLFSSRSISPFSVFLVLLILSTRTFSFISRLTCLNKSTFLHSFQ